MPSTGLGNRYPILCHPPSRPATSRVSTSWRYVLALAMGATSTVKISSLSYPSDYQSRSTRASRHPKHSWKVVSLQTNPPHLPHRPKQLLTHQQRQHKEVSTHLTRLLGSQYSPSMLPLMTMRRRATRTRLDRIFPRSMGTEVVTSPLLHPKARLGFPTKRDDEDVYYAYVRFYSLKSSCCAP